MHASLVKSLTALSLALTLVYGCGGGDEQTANAAGAEVLAKVNNEPITRTQIEVLRDSKSAQEDGTKPDEQRLLSELINLKLIAQAAEQEGLGTSAQVQAQVEYARNRALVNAFIQHMMGELEVTEEALRELYAQQFDDTTEYKARHILHDDKAAAAESIAKLDAGADFVELAKNESTGPSGKSGGDLGWFTAKTMIPAFSDAVAKMEPGTYSEEPLQTRFGWHVIKLEQTRESEPPAFEEVKPKLRSILANRRLQERIMQLRQAAQIEVMDAAQAAPDSSAPAAPADSASAAAPSAGQ